MMEVPKMAARYSALTFYSTSVLHSRLRVRLLKMRLLLVLHDLAVGCTTVTLASMDETIVEMWHRNEVCLTIVSFTVSQFIVSHPSGLIISSDTSQNSFNEILLAS